MPYEVHTPVFEGDLELLTQLVSRQELDVFGLCLASLVEAFLAEAKAAVAAGAEPPDLDTSTEFLLLAATLVDGPTVFVVFASWCGHCRDELRVLSELRAERPGLKIVGLNAYEDWGDASDDEKLRVYLAEHAPWLPVVKADASLLESLGGVPKIPSLFVFDGRGQLVEAFRRHERRPPSLGELRAALNRAR